MHMKKLLLSLPLALAALPVFAQTPEYTEVSTPEQFLSALEQLKPAVRVMADLRIESESAILVDCECTLDLNGHTLSVSRPIGHRGTTSFIITDESEAKTGKLVGDNGALIAGTPGPVYLKGGEITNAVDASDAVINNTKFGNIFLEGAVITATHHSQALDNAGNFTINGGRIVGYYMSIAPVNNEGEGLITFNAGAAYAGNRTNANCFENMIWSDGEETEIARTILPEGFFDGGAVVTSDEWAIPGTNYINYHLPEDALMQPGNHYYYAEDEFDLPGCDYYKGVPFAGWSTAADLSGELMTHVAAGLGKNLDLYPVWKYTTISENCTPDLTPASVTPEPDTQVETLSQIVLHYGEGDFYANETEGREYGYITNSLTGEKVATLGQPSTDWDGNITFTASQEITASGTYRVFIAAGAFGSDDWYYSDYEEGRCNPDLFYKYTITKVTDAELTVDPQPNTSVEKLDVIALTFRNGADVTYEYDGECKLTSADGLTNLSLTWNQMSYEYLEEGDVTYEQVVITLDEPVTAAGTYTLQVPEGFFSYDYGSTPIAAFTLSWNVAESGVETLGTDRNLSAPVIYDLTGRRIPASALENLSPGIYIINGRKQVVR